MSNRCISAIACALAVSSLPVAAAEVPFSGGASGVDPLGHQYAFNATRFLLSTGSLGFNPDGTLIGQGTSARSFNFTLTGPATLNPEPVNVPNACPEGQYATYINLNPLTIVCVGAIGGGPIIRHTWTYRMINPGTGTFDAPEGAAPLESRVSPFDFSLTFPQPVDPSTFSFTASWSDISPVPEPTTSALFLLGVATLVTWQRRVRSR